MYNLKLMLHFSFNKLLKITCAVESFPQKHLKNEYFLLGLSSTKYFPLVKLEKLCSFQSLCLFILVLPSILGRTDFEGFLLLLFSWLYFFNKSDQIFPFTFKIRGFFTFSKQTASKQLELEDIYFPHPCLIMSFR